MVFSSILFIFYFLPAFLILYYITPQKFRNIPALAASYIFYAWGEPIFVVVLFFSSVVDYILSKLIAGTSFKRLWLILSLTLNVGLLIVFKYSGFLIVQLNHLLSSMNVTELSVPLIVLPLGISFFTFQKLSYVIDVYRDNVKPAQNFISYALYVSLFPQLIAGPIVRYHDINRQLGERTYSGEKFCSGLYRFILGLGKKVLIANYVATISDTVFKYTGYASTWQVWLGAVAFSIQIYFDFSGYSDMAIGLGKMLGFEFLENFRRPYTSKSVSEFWKRWHISLCNWMSEYLYIPLGGNRKGKFRTYINLWIVFLVSGFWHGASWTFIIWGAFHGAVLSIEKIIGSKRLKKIPSFFGQLITLYLIVVSFVIFNAVSFAQLKEFLIRMHTVSFQSINCPALFWYNLCSIRALFMMLTGIIISVYPQKLWHSYVEKWKTLSTESLRYIQASVIAFLIFAMSIMSLIANGFNPFIYFQF